MAKNPIKPKKTKKMAASKTVPIKAEKQDFQESDSKESGKSKVLESGNEEKLTKKEKYFQINFLK